MAGLAACLVLWVKVDRGVFPSGRGRLAWAAIERGTRRRLGKEVPMSTRRRGPSLLASLFLASLLAACSGGASPSPGPSGPSAPTGTVGLTVLGNGTDVFGPYAVDANVKARVLDTDALNAAGRLVFDPAVQEYRYEEAAGRTINEYASHLGATLGLSGSYLFFSAELQSSFSSDAYRRTEYSYASIIERHWAHSLKVEPGLWGSGERLRPFLTPLARQAINDTDPTGKRWTPAEVIQVYGTHVLTGIYAGGRLDYHLAVQVMDAANETNVMAFAKAKYGSSYASAEISGGLESSVREVMEQYNRVGPVISAKGGAAQYANPTNDDDYKAWKASLSTNPVYCGIVSGGLTGLWELAETPARRAELQAAFAAYAVGKESEYAPLFTKITDLKVINAGKSTAVTLPAGYQLLRALSGDTASGDLNMGIWNDTQEADQVYLAYLAQPTAAPVGVASLHLQSSDATFDGLLNGGATHEALYGPAEAGCTANAGVDLNAGTCGGASLGEWYSGWCAFYFWNASCPTAATPLTLHFQKETATTRPARCVVMGDELAIDVNQPAETRAAHIWWGPPDVNADGKVGDAADAAWVLSHVTWVRNRTDDGLVNLNQGVQSFARYDWYDCGLGEGWDDAWANPVSALSDAQYLGYCPDSP